MNHQDLLNLVELSERLHKQFLEAIQLELERLKKRDINDVRALMILNIGDAEMTVSELVCRGCYLGTNVSYNLKKLTDAGYIIQTRSQHDRRVVMVRNSEKGAELRTILADTMGRRIAGLGQNSCREQDIVTCGHVLKTLQSFLNRGGDFKPDIGLATSRAGAPEQSIKNDAALKPVAWVA